MGGGGGGNERVGREVFQLGLELLVELLLLGVELVLLLKEGGRGEQAYCVLLPLVRLHVRAPGFHFLELPAKNNELQIMILHIIIGAAGNVNFLNGSNKASNREELNAELLTARRPGITDSAHTYLPQTLHL